MVGAARHAARTAEVDRLLPCTSGAVQTLVDKGKLEGGDAINQELQHIAPLFPRVRRLGTGTSARRRRALINAAARGDLSVQDALNQLADEAQQLQSGG